MWLFKTRNKYPQTDTEIVAAYKQTGDTKLMGILFERYAHLVYGVCFNYIKDQEVCKDATLIIFEKLFTDLKKYEVSNFSSWLHTVTRNHCFAYMKTSNRIVTVDESYLTNQKQDDETDISDELILNHLDYLDSALATLNEEQKNCIKLFYLEEKSYSEITNITGYTLNQVKSYIQNGKRNLKIYLTTK